MAATAFRQARIAACWWAAALLTALPAQPLRAATPSFSSSTSLSRTPIGAKPTVSSRIAGQARTGQPIAVRITIANVGPAGAKLGFSSDRPMKLSAAAAKSRQLPPGDSAVTLRATARSSGVHFIYVSLQHDGGGSLTPIPVDVQSRDAKATPGKAGKPSRTPEAGGLKKSIKPDAQPEKAGKKKRRKTKKTDHGSATGVRGRP